MICGDFLFEETAKILVTHFFHDHKCNQSGKANWSYEANVAKKNKNKKY